MGAFTSDAVKRHAPPVWFPLAHAEAIQAHPRLELAAVCDTQMQAAERAAAAYGAPEVFTDAAAMIERVRPSLVGIATRTLGRAALIEQAVGSNVHALHIEKPLCNSVTEFDALAAIFERPDVFVTYGAIRRFLAPYRQARQLADSGRYGALREIRISLGGPGALYWTHPHSIDLILHAAGARAVVGVQARFEEALTGPDVDEDPTLVSAVIYFEDGVTGVLSRGLGNDVVISCADAEIAVLQNGTALGIYAGHGGGYASMQVQDPLSETGAPGGTLAPISQLVACLDGDTDAVAANAVVKSDILRGQRIAFAMIQSHLEGSRIVTEDAIDPSMVLHGRSGSLYA